MSKAHKPCPFCGGEPTVSPTVNPTPQRNWDYQAYCDNCNDGAPDAGPQCHGHGSDPELALLDWDENYGLYEEEDHAQH